jgi:hypothetical protein
MEDALISPEGFMILSGAGLIEASAATATKDVVYYADGEVSEEGTIDVNGTLKDNAKIKEIFNGTTWITMSASTYSDGVVTFTENVGAFTVGAVVKIKYTVAEPVAGNSIKVHVTEKVKVESDGIYVKKKPYVNGDEDLIYVMIVDSNGDVTTEPYIYTCNGTEVSGKGFKLTLKTNGYAAVSGEPKVNDVVLVDYYVEKTSDAKQINIEPGKFGGNYYLEASTLFRDTNGVDMPAEFIIPNCKIQSNFTFTMASSGDPSTFTFTMDAFPDYTRFDNTKKVLSAIQIITEGADNSKYTRNQTVHHPDHDDIFVD